jgi:putative ABC transport system permease protein
MASAVSCTPGYLQTLGVRLTRGRVFAESDDAGHPAVMVIGATTARHLFGNAAPIGQTLTIPKFRYQLAAGTEATVVGIVDDVKYSGLDVVAGDQVYMPLAQMPWLSTFLVLRSDAGVNVAPTIRRVVASIDPTVAVSAIQSLDGIVSTTTAPARFRTTLIAAFALLGLAIAGIGLYGIVAYSTSQRTTEIGVRIALGAATRDVMQLVLREGVGMALAGLALGIPLAYAVSRTVGALLFAVKPTDPLTYGLAVVVVLAVALAASYAPAIRAARVDPMVSLRTE